MTLEEFVARALAVPFVPKGRSWDGWDCWGVVYLAYRELRGEELPTYLDRYRRRDLVGTEHLGALVGDEARGWESVDPSNARPLDVAVFRLEGRPVHVGLIVAGGRDSRVLHTESRVGTFVERLRAPLWARRLEGIFRRG